MALITLVVLAILTLLCGQVEAILIPASSSVGPPPPGPGSGLSGEFHDADVADAAAAEALVTGTATPTATFTSTAINYPNSATNTASDSTPLLTFLGVDGASLSPASAGTATLTDSVFGFTGFIKIISAFDTSPGGTIDVTFAVGSDDGFRLSIGGVVVTQFLGLRQFRDGIDPITSGVASFEAEGLYPFVLSYFENQVFTGIEACSSIPGGSNPGCPTGTVGIIPAAVLFQTPPAGVPEPASLFILATGIVGLSLAARKQRTRRAEEVAGS